LKAKCRANPPTSQALALQKNVTLFSLSIVTVNIVKDKQVDLTILLIEMVHCIRTGESTSCIMKIEIPIRIKIRWWEVVLIVAGIILIIKSPDLVIRLLEAHAAK
jgi:hypothetical protein